MIRTGTITALRARHPPCEMCSIALKTMGYFKSTNNQMSSLSPDCITHVYLRTKLLSEWSPLKSNG